MLCPIVKFGASPHERALSDTALEKDTRAFYAAFSALVRLYQFRDRDRICCHNVSVTQCYALDAMAQHQAMTLNKLAAELSLDKSTASRVVDALERKGYVTRSRNSEDGRALDLAITKSGRRLHQLIVRDALAEERAILAPFPRPVRRAMTQMIHQLARAVSERTQCCTKTACNP